MDHEDLIAYLDILTGLRIEYVNSNAEMLLLVDQSIKNTINRLHSRYF